MIWIDENFITEHVSFNELIQELKLAFRENKIQSPSKQVYNYSGSKNAEKNTFLFMPSWDNKTFFGTKLVTITSSNKKKQLPYIQGIYVLFDAKNGSPLIGMDAKVMTNIRTAATSALAASFLITEKASSLLIIGNGNLSPYFIKAHNSVRRYKKNYLWGRNKASSEIIKKQLAKESIEVAIVDDFKEVSPIVDVISCLTSAKAPILTQAYLGRGQHIDLVGSFSPEMHEVTTEVIKNSSVYSDNLNTTPLHAGELVKAISENVLSLKTIQGDLVSLCKTDHSKRKNDLENTLFKSTGMAFQDLVIAQLIFKKHEQTRK
ncbi:hypothetical protein [Tenacibaculum xiamenense]|uniref:hypothetical protein n=1 Tax=Tenacibaculum xiamenense TaxID=1261553 RepID=UPI003895418A